MDGKRMDSKHEAGTSRLSSVYDSLSEDLRNYKFLPKERLVVEELAERYSVSNTPIREVLNRLHEIDFIDFEPRRGFFVKIPNVDDLTQLYELLGAVTGSTIVKVTVSESRQPALELLWSCHGRLARIATDSESDEQLGIFHTQAVYEMLRELFQLAGNSIMARTASNILDRTYFAQRIEYEKQAYREECVDTLKMVMNAMEAGDEYRCLTLIRDLLTAKVERMPVLVPEIIGRLYTTGGR